MDKQEINVIMEMELQSLLDIGFKLDLAVQHVLRPKMEFYPIDMDTELNLSPFFESGNKHRLTELAVCFAKWRDHRRNHGLYPFPLTLDNIRDLSDQLNFLRRQLYMTLEKLIGESEDQD